MRLNHRPAWLARRARSEPAESCAKFSRGLGFRVQGLGFRVEGFGFRVKGFSPHTRTNLGEVSGQGFRVQGLGFRVSGSSIFGVHVVSAPTLAQGRQGSAWLHHARQLPCGLYTVNKL